MKCECGKAVDINVADTIIENVYRWSFSYHCKKCGNAVELDGMGIENLPEDIKKLLITKYGEWAISSTNKSNKVKVKYLLKKMSIGESVEFCDIDSDIILKGTENEMRWISLQLSKKKITDCNIIKVS